MTASRILGLHGIEYASVRNTPTGRQAANHFPGAMYPILFVPGSVNQRLPSGPVVIPWGLRTVVGSANSVILRADEVGVPVAPPCGSVALLVPVEFVLPPVPPQAVRRTKRISPGMPMRTNLRMNWEEIRIKVTPFAKNNSQTEKISFGMGKHARQVMPSRCHFGLNLG
jgi:hypothetical protein